jgi:hypothetical protein
MTLLTSPFAIPVVAIVMVFGYLIIQSIVAGVRGIVKHRNEIELKQSLVERGMSAEEIERIIVASNLGDDTE